MIIDGGKGLQAAVKKAFRKRALIQRCQWHKRENVVSYLSEPPRVSRRLQLLSAYEVRSSKKNIVIVNQFHITAWAVTPKFEDLATNP